MALPVGLLGKGLLGVAAVVAPISAYVIPREINKNKLRKENIELNEKIKALGIDSGCHFQDIAKTADCKLNADQLKAVKFSDKSGDTVTQNASVSLKIEKLTGEDLPSDLLFTFTNTTTDLDIGTDPNKVTLKGGTSYDYKIKTDNNSNEIKLEKAWDLTTLAKKLGITCTNGTNTECTFGDNINVWKNENNYMTKATGTASKKICVAKDTAKYHQEFKFTLEDSTVSLTENATDGTKKGSELTQLTKTNMSYEIALKDMGGNEGKKWFLVEKDTTPS